MPEDYQTILDDLGVDTSSTNQGDQGTDQNTTGDATPPADNNTGDNSGDNTGDAGSAVNSQPATNQQQQVDPNVQRRNDAFAAMRSENSKYKKFIQQIMKGAGYEGDEDGFMNQLTEASYKRQAQRQGNQVSPELLKRMDTLESQNKSLIDSQNRQMFASNMSNLQKTFNLTDDEMKEFVELAVREKIDLTVPGSNFVTLYQGLFFDKLKTKIIEEERQKWIAQNSKANSAANPDGKSGKKDPAPTNVNTMAEFDSLLQQSFPSNKK